MTLSGLLPLLLQLAPPAATGAFTYATVLVVVAIAQGSFLASILVLLLINRGRQRRRTAQRVAADAGVVEPLRRWLVHGGDASGVADALRAMPREFAIEQVSALVAMRVAPAELDALATALRGEAWVQAVLAGARSRFWWRRLQAARLLAAVTGDAERALLKALLADPHPAVQTVATACLGRGVDLAMIGEVIDRLPGRPPAVRLYQFGALKAAWQLAEQALVARLASRDVPPGALEVWVSLAEFLGTPAALACALPLASHPDAIVRLAVARALKRYFHADSVPTLRLLLADTDWRVRGQAARALGALRAHDAIPDLTAALADRAWWVRFRSGLALAGMGEAGRRALRDARGSPDRYGSEMAAMISGLSDGVVVELAEA